MGEGDRAQLKDKVNTALAAAEPEARKAHLPLLRLRAAAVGRSDKAEAEGHKTTQLIDSGQSQIPPRAQT